MKGGNMENEELPEGDSPELQLQNQISRIIEFSGSKAAAARALGVAHSTVRRVERTGKASPATRRRIYDELHPGDDCDLPWTY